MTGSAGPRQQQQQSQHHRKESGFASYTGRAAGLGSKWTSWLPFDLVGRSWPVKDKDEDGLSALPTYGKRGGVPPSPRPFYSSEKRDQKRGFLLMARDVSLRPIYVLSRRSPVYVLCALVVVVLFVLNYSTSPSTQTVKLRVQGAVRPYIPQRAADAMQRYGKGGRRKKKLPKAGDAPAPLRDNRKVEADHIAEDFRKEREQAAKEAAKQADKAKKKRPTDAELAPLPPIGIDSRIPLEAGKPHPIPALMAKARKDWAELKGRQSKTFAEAVEEYKRRYGRNPPKGFDRWYAFAKAHNVLLIDEFDLIDKDLLMYRAFKPEVFRKRVTYLPEAMDTTWTIRVQRGRIYREGPLGHHDRAKGVEKLMARFAPFLPDMKIVYNGHDNARIAVAAEERIRLEGLAKRGEYDDDEEPPFDPKERGPFPNWGYPIFCPPDSPARQLGFENYGYHADLNASGFEMPPHPEGAIGSLIGNFKNYMDVCYAPHYRHTHCTTSWVFSHHPTPVLPFFSPGVQSTFGDIHALIVEQLELEAKHDPTWEERPFTALQWRGQTSGPLWEKLTPWRTSQRARLHLLSHQEEGARQVTLVDDDDIMQSAELSNYRLNPLFLDTGMVGPAVQCVKEDGTCDEMYEVFQGYDKRISFDRASLYKYVLDVDGNSWSGRFRRLMLSNAAVVKATIFPEFWTDWAIPWLHFIPMQVDYADMWDIMAFFRGGLDGERAHDALGKEIAMAGKEWVKQCYRWADLEAYQFRLLLEYGRLYTDETHPGSNDFDGDTSVEPTWNGPIRDE
ncbi:hypothetical protein JCM10908_000268 [Rhodotorula pacifica]|uniref:uncharacterized protein n=1 Tax=Rhodotorula pacifica TaxID=1495444 RepID=UPI00317157E0